MPRASKLRVVSGGRETGKPKPKPKVEPLSRQEIEDWADNLPLKFLFCRSKKHNLVERDTWPHGRGFATLWRCTSCRLEVTEIINAAGFVVEAKPEYPKGYLAPKGAGRATKERNAMMRIRRARRFYDSKKTD